VKKYKGIEKRKMEGDAKTGKTDIRYPDKRKKETR